MIDWAKASEGKALGAEDSGGHIEPLAIEMPDGIVKIEK